MNAVTWKWVREAPLAPIWRRRLELCLGVVLTTAAVVALSARIGADPRRLALHPAPTRVAIPPLPAVEDAAARPSLSPAMMAAARSGDARSMRAAYRSGMPLDGTLRLAAHAGHDDAVFWLLAHGADVHEDEHTTVAPMLEADAFPEIATLLRSKGAAEPTLLNAAIAGAPNALARALADNPQQAKQRGVLASAARALWKTPAMKRSVLTKLLDAGADPNDAGALASVVMDLSLVRLFLDRGAHPTGETIGAALSRDDEARAAVLDALLERPLENGVTASALAHATNATSDDVARLVKLGVDWSWHDGEEDEALPLLAAVRHGDRDYARMLVAAGAPVDVHYKDGITPLAEAIDGSASDDSRARIVELLVEHGASVHRRFPDGRTPLYAAAESGNIRVVNFLLARGARVNDQVLYETALDAAEQHGNTPAARVLAAHGAVRTRTFGY